MPQGKYFRIGYAIIIVTLIIYLLSKIDFVFQPLFMILQILFTPIALAGVLFYLLRPFVKLLSNWMPKGIAILLIYVTGVGMLTTVFLLVGPEIQRQFHSLVANMPRFIYEVRDMFIELQNNERIAQFQAQNQQFSWEELTREAAAYINNFVQNLGANVTNVLGAVANFLILLVIIPFILYYMLKEGEKAPNQITRFLSPKNEQEAKRVLGDMDAALSSYIQGQIIVSFCVGVLVYIGYQIIGLDYPLILALVAMFTNVIPFIGPWIGTFPGVIVGLFDSVLTGLLVVLVVVIVQQIESNLISPQVMGRKLSIHPVTILLLLLVAGRFAGLIGLILAVPTYAILKVIVSHTYRLIKLRHNPADDSSL
ncbi:AI-2E family transporter [Salsuginibacillus kocurii]|uniref:AI-2E family transporter n=1 Tax=Salsuginibacillus kocurii TaxID=427078 RepID=UPI00036C39BB|nr:AI-2E family transporter [Salsuginibacillus kocurii]